MAAWIAGLIVVPAAASTAGSAGPGAAVQPGRSQPWIAITSVQPGFVQPTTKVTVSGIVANPTSSPLPGLSVQLGSSSNPLTSSAMASYLTAPASTSIDSLILGTQHTLRSPVPAHGTEPWSMTLAENQVGMHTFGVYPLAAHLEGPGGAQLGVVDRTFLPFWPGKAAARTLKPASIAWIWPLIDIPQRTVCRTLTSNELAASVRPHGRLGSLLAAGQTTVARQALLTWAIDPALLNDLSVMSGRYRVTGTGKCSAGKPKPASNAAKTWLGGLHAIAAQGSYFTTPYADVDVAALAHLGLGSQLQAALTDGRLTATRATVPGTQKKILGQSQQVTPASVGPIAWPADGIANYGDLEALAKDGIQTVILSSRMIHTPAAVTTLPNGFGGQLNVLLANNTLTQILSGRRDQITGLVPAVNALSPGAHAQARLAAAFAKEQWFLAQTAVIAAGAPARGTAIIVAPPRHWDPLRGMATTLLTDTGQAPWLRPATLATLASMAGARSQTGQLPSRPLTRGELSASLLQQAGNLYKQIRLLDSILPARGNGYLSTALDTVESSAWRGRTGAQRRAGQLLRHDLNYVNGQLRQLSIIVSNRVTLGGQNGLVPVSIRNGLGQPVTVRLEASAPPADHLSIGKFNGLVTVQGHTQRTIKIPVTASQAGSATLTLRLATKNDRALPVRNSLTVAATHFGTLAIVIISVALVVFLLSATARAIRRGGPQDGGSGADAEELDPMPSTPDPASVRDEPDTVVPEGADERHAAKEADEHASAPGRADRI